MVGEIQTVSSQKVEFPFKDGLTFGGRRSLVNNEDVDMVRELANKALFFVFSLATLENMILQKCDRFREVRIDDFITGTFLHQSDHCLNISIGNISISLNSR